MSRHQFFTPLLARLLLAKRDSLQQQIIFLKAENQILRSRLPKRIRLTNSEKLQLLQLGQPLGISVRDLISVVTYKFFRIWINKKKQFLLPLKSKGRPRILPNLENINLKIAQETGWGYTRIIGELKKLGFRKISASTVKNVLKRNGIDPGPNRGPGTWHDFVNQHIETLWACDFFSSRVWTLEGWKRFYVLFFIHIKTSKIIALPATAKPDKKWMAEQAVAFCKMAPSYAENEKGFLIHDGDFKFTHEFDQTLKSNNIDILQLPPKSPNLNAFAERWIRSLKHECLNHFVIFGQRHLDHLVQEYLKYYHELRPHQGVGNKTLHDKVVVLSDDDRPVEVDQVICRNHLGGVFKDYARAAA